MDLHPISGTELAQRTQEVVHRVRQGHPAVVHSSGEDQVVLLDAFDYRLLRGVTNWATHPVAPASEDETTRVMRAYLDREISLGRAAELLSVSRFELQARFVRLEIPLRQGPADLAEAKAEVEVALRAGHR